MSNKPIGQVEVAELEALQRDAAAFRWLIAQPETTWHRIAHNPWKDTSAAVRLRRRTIETEMKPKAPQNHGW